MTTPRRFAAGLALGVANSPGQSAQPGSPFYGNNRELLASGHYFPLPHTRAGVGKIVAYKLTITP